MAMEERLLWVTTTVILLFVSPHLCSASCCDLCICLGAIIDCSKTGITEVPEDLPEWVEKLDLSQNKGLRITPGVFQDLPMLKTLYLCQLDLERLPPLGHLPALTDLYLGGNQVTKVEDVNLAGLPRLQHLDLSKNRLTSLTHKPFTNVTLVRLNLSKNMIAHLDAAAFQTLGSLAELKLSRNLLTPASFNHSAPIFTNLTNLRILDLNGNRLNDLQGLMFKDLKKLRVLKMRKNEITTFSDGAFYGLDSIEKLYLDYNNITVVRKGLLFDLKSLEHLYLKSNQIHSIRADTWQSTERLVSLDLSHNRLLELREGTFRGLGRLTTLLLSHNHLAHIERNTFEPTSNLIDLELSHNQLRWSIEDNSGAFNSLSHLKTLALAYNDIETIHVETFKPLVSLTSLDLLGNELRTLPHNPFSGLIHLASIQLNTSSLVCDCHLSWLPSWLSSISNSSSSSMTVACNYPSSLKDRRVMSLMGTDFSCESSPRPIISQSPKDQIVLHGSNVTLACVAQAGAGGDQPRFMWRKNNQLLIDFPMETRVQVINLEGKGGAIHNITSFLHLENVSDADSGEYQCVVRNNFGASYSQRSHIQVHIFPFFTKRPASVAVRIGEMAKLECVAGGSPAPEISLLKDGGEDFPAARERRIHVLSNETLFFIKPVKPHDEGLYTCRATNAAGTAAAHASVTVHQIPEFTKSPKDEVATLGDNAVLECQGKGLPIPKLTWTKNGVTLENDGHYVLVEDSQYLLIKETRQEDVGTYTCELTNILGTARGRISLSIRDSSSTSTTTGIVVMAVVCCVVVTSLVWVVIIHQTRKRARTSALASPRSFPREEGGLGRYPASHRHLTAAHHHHLAPDLMHKLTPLLTGAPDNYPGVGAQDSGSEHSSGKDSGTGDSQQRSNEDLLPLDLSRPGMRRSLIICADSRSSPIMRGVNGVSIGGGGEVGVCEEPLGRPRLSTFSPQHLSPSSYSPGHYTASLRRGSNSRLLPVSSPVTPSSTLPRGPPHSYQPRPSSPYQAVSVSPSSSEASGRHNPQPVLGERGDLVGGCEDEDCVMQESYGCNTQHLANGDLPLVHNSEGVTHTPRTSVCSASDRRSELDLRMETPEIRFSSNIPPIQMLETR